MKHKVKLVEKLIESVKVVPNHEERGIREVSLPSIPAYSLSSTEPQPKCADCGTPFNTNGANTGDTIYFNGEEMLCRDCAEKMEKA